MSAYYNENDPHAAAWLRELIRRGLIASGDVDERSSTEVQPDDRDYRIYQGSQEQTPASSFQVRVRFGANRQGNEGSAWGRDAVRALREGGSGEARWREETATRPRAKFAGSVVGLQIQCASQRAHRSFVFRGSGNVVIAAMRLLRRGGWRHRQDRLVARLHRRQRRAVLCDLQLRQTRHAARRISRVGGART